MSAFASPTVEDEIACLRTWWLRNCKPFSEWWLSLSDALRLALIKKGCPDMPEVTSATRASKGEALKTTDYLLPEIAEDALMSSGGRICVLFITRRMSPDLCIPADIRMLRDLSKVNKLPLFPLGEVVRGMDCPFIDPSNEEHVQCLTADTSAATRREVLDAIESGRYASVQVWAALKVRRTAIATFVRILFENFEENCDPLWRPKPLLKQLLAAEMKMQANDADVVASASESSMEKLS
jgi:hypothetical protein